MGWLLKYKKNGRIVTIAFSVRNGICEKADPRLREVASWQPGRAHPTLGPILRGIKSVLSSFILT